MKIKVFIIVSLLSIMFYSVSGFAQGIPKMGVPKIPPQCTSVTFSPAGQYDLNPGRHLGFIMIKTNTQECWWQAKSSADWIRIKTTGINQYASAVNGAGNARIDYEVEKNTGAPNRSGTIAINGKYYTISQEGCRIGISGGAKNHGPQSEKGIIKVSSTHPDCTWKGQSPNSWIRITSSGTGSGEGQVEYEVSGNPASIQRTGTITIGDLVKTVNQQGATPCSVTLAPTEKNHQPGSSTNGIFDVHAGSECYWATQSDAGWIRIMSGQNGTGNGKVTYAVENNPAGSSARWGIIRTGGRSFRVNQEGCIVKLSPASHSFPPSLQGICRVEMITSCPWNAKSSAGWLKIIANQSGDKTAEVEYVLDRNTNAETRTGAITVGGQACTVIQKGCFDRLRIGFGPPVSARGGDLDVEVIGDCRWDASSNTEWIQIASMPPFRVTYAVSRNPASTPRTGTVTIAGKIFTVVQPGSTGSE